MLTTILFTWLAIGVVWVALTALPAGLEAHMPMPYLIALAPFLWIPSVAFAALAGWFGQWGAMCSLLVLAIAASSRRIDYWGTSLTPKPSAPARPVGERGASHGTSRETSRETQSDDRGTSRETPRATPAPSRLNLMTLNCRYGHADADAIVREVASRSIDVLALQEVSDDLVARLDAAGVARLLPYRRAGEAKESDNGGYNMLLSAYEPGAATANVVGIPAADVPAITMRLADGRTATIASAHPKSPMRGCADWSAGILGLGALAQAKHIDDRNIAIVMGDLNSSTDHPSFRALLRSGFRDASLKQGSGPHTTFPSWLPWPRIELDHILATPGVRFSDVASFKVPDTDHLALTGVVTLR